MSSVLRIRDWDGLYENAETRKLKFLHWVRVPNTLDGAGYAQLVAHPDGAAHLGVWVALLEVASRCSPRGTLIRDNGTAFNATTLALKTRLPGATFDAAIPRLIEIGWVEVIDVESGDSPDGVGELPEVSGGHPVTFGLNRTVPVPEQDKKSICASKDDALVSDQPDSLPVCQTSHEQPTKAKLRDGLTEQQEEWFSAWWQAYWRKVARKPAQRAFARLVRTQERFDQVIKATLAQAPEMLSRPPEKRPHGATWLNAERWNDELLEEAPPQRTQKDPTGRNNACINGALEELYGGDAA